MTDTTSPDRSAIEAHQLAQLQALIPQLRETNPFYRDRLRDAGVDGSIGSLAEFSRRVSFTTKAELAADQDAHPPYGTNLTFPIERYTRLHQTSSTTGKPMRWLDTPESWDWMLDGWIKVFKAEGVTSKDRLFAAFSFGPFIGFWLGYEAAQKMGCLVIPGGSMNSVTRLRAILANNVTVLCCTPTYAIRIGEVAREEGMDLSKSSVRTIVVGGEPGGSIPAVRDRIESLWPGANVFDHHGMTEIGPGTHQCPKQAGVLHLLEWSLYCEYIDAETGLAMPADSDEVSELVITTLGRTGSPLLRYRTGDLVRPGPIGQCECGLYERTLLGGVIGRTDDMIFVRGVNLYPSAVDQIIHSLEGIAEYRVEISELRGMTELNLLIEPEANEPDPEGLKRSIADTFHSIYNLRVPIELVAPNTLPRFELKAKRWVKIESEQPA
ncbi:MAG: AMP-binding protein [Planctomycetota bacterium]|nr:AMP-binding protein [Planctomycetota bacterium]